MAPTFEWRYLPELNGGIQGEKYSSKNDRKLKENMQNFHHSSEPIVCVNHVTGPVPQVLPTSDKQTLL